MGGYYILSVAPVLEEGEKAGKEPALFSVGINSTSLGVFKKEEKAVAVLSELESFVCDKTTRFQVPADK